VIQDSGVRNTASLSPLELPTIAPQMLITIFGINLSTGTETANGYPLPGTLAGASVTIGGAAAPLLYASPTQINAQVPSVLPAVPGSADVVVTTAGGSSDPVPVAISYRALGIFTRDASGCGPGSVFNVHADGSLSLNTPDDSFDPRSDWGFTIFLTGLGLVRDRQDGMPASYNPKNNLAPVNISAFVGVEGVNASTQVLNSLSSSAYLGPAPGLVGIDQMNVPIFPANPSFPEGCHLPLVISDFQNSTSQIVNVSIHGGGGACADASASSLASIAWKKSVVSSRSGLSVSDSVSVQFLRDGDLAFPRPDRAQFSFAPCCRPSAPLVPSACSSSLPRAFDGGSITVSGPGFGPLEVSDEAMLPPGAIGGGDYHVASLGTAVMGAFTAIAHIPAPITITTNLAPDTTLSLPMDVTWSGGDAQSTISVEIIVHPKDQPLLTAFDQRVSVAALKGSVQIGTAGPLPPFGVPGPAAPAGNVEILVTQDAAAAPAQPFTAAGLSMGGEQRWSYSFDYRGLKH
jgi:uncharacterized protein (TIGR03437 family)